MTAKLDDATFDKIVTACEYIVKKCAPNPKTRYITSSGNLAHNAVRVRVIDRTKMKFVIYIDEDIAPYMADVSSKRYWNDGRPYEYYKWYDDACASVAMYLCRILGGKIV